MYYFKIQRIYLVFKNNDGLFIGLYTFDLVDKNKVELFLEKKK